MNAEREAFILAVSIIAALNAAFSFGQLNVYARFNRKGNLRWFGQVVSSTILAIVGFWLYFAA